MEAALGISPCSGPGGRANSGCGAGVRVRMLEVGQGRLWACGSASRKRAVRLWKGLCESGGPHLSPLLEASVSPQAQVCGAPPPTAPWGIQCWELLLLIKTMGLALAALSSRLDPCGHGNRKGSSGCRLGRLATLCPTQAPEAF